MGRILALLLLTAQSALAQGFADLGSDAGGFANPLPNPSFSFPADHGAHPDYRIEWWYLTANLTGPDGTAYGVQWTLFRSALAPDMAEGWDAPQLFMGHAAVTTPDQHLVAERLARGGIGQADVSTTPFSAFIDDWQMTSTAAPGEDALSALTVTARGPDFAYELALTASGPLIFHGEGGYSVKSAAGQASYYYSQPFYTLTGTLSLPEGEFPVTGTAWLDREWSSQPLAEDQTGWDWFSLQFEDGARLMAFALRGTDTYTSATWIERDGTTTAYTDGAITLTPLDETVIAGRAVPTEWRLQFPERGIDIRTTPINPEAWMDVSFPYWEGPISFTGSHDGIGYLEMTGY